MALIGRNGEGKSSLLRLLRGEAEPDQGTVWLKTGARVAHLAQDIIQVADLVHGLAQGVRWRNTALPAGDAAEHRRLDSCITSSMPAAAGSYSSASPRCSRGCSSIPMRASMRSRAARVGAHYWRGRW